MSQTAVNDGAGAKSPMAASGTALTVADARFAGRYSSATSAFGLIDVCGGW